MEAFPQEMQEFFDKQIDDIEKLVSTTNNFDLNYYFIREKNLIKYINENTPENKRKQFKRLFKHYLKAKFLSNRFELRKKLINKIHSRFYLFLNRINTIDDLNAIQYSSNLFYSVKETEKNNNTHLMSELKAVIDKTWNRCEAFIYLEMDNFSNCPKFILSNEKKILKERILTIYKKHFDIPFDEIALSDHPMFVNMKQLFLDFITNKLNLFDAKYYDNDTKKALFDFFIKANRSYLLHENNNKIFLNNLKKYLCIIGISDEIGKYNQMITNYTTQSNESNNTLDLDNSFQVLVTKLHLNMNDNNNIKLYFLIFSFSCLLNNFVQYNENKEEYNVISISFMPQFLCSSREKQFLFNFITTLDNYLSLNNEDQMCMNLYYILENYIFKDLIKEYAKALFENNKIKLQIPFIRIYNFLTQVNPMHPYYKNQTKSDDDKHNGYIFNSLPDSYRLKFSALFSAFISSYGKSLILPEEDNDEENIINKMKYGMSSIIHQIKPKDDVDNIILNNISLIPLDPFSISTHICLCVYGLFYPNQSSLPMKNIWSNLIKDKRNVEFYTFNWQDESNFYKTGVTKNVVGFISKLFSNEPKKQYGDINKENMTQMILNNKKLSKFYGRFLAYVLLSRAVFKFQSISLIGYSLGCNVIKYCLKELAKINKQEVNTEEIIHNVIFIAGATTIQDKNKGILNIASGKVINCYSSYDKVLSAFYSKSAFGLNGIKFEMKDKSKDYMLEIENIDLSWMRLDHDDYKTEIPNIIRRISVL